MRKIVKKDIVDFRNGSVKSFELIYLAYFNKIKLYVFKFIQDDFEVNNLVQDVFVKLWENREKIDEDRDILYYILAITRNKCLSYLRHKKYEQQYVLEKLSSINSNKLFSQKYEGNKFIEKELENNILKALNSLPYKLKETFLLSRNHYLRYDEIAKKQNISKKTVEYRITKALKILEIQLKDYIV